MSSSMPNYREVFGQEDSDDDVDALDTHTHLRTSAEIARFDQEVLDEEEENEKLLTGRAAKGRHDPTYNAWAPGEGASKGRSSKGRSGRSERKKMGEVGKEMMRRLEEGAMPERAESEEEDGFGEKTDLGAMPVRQTSRFWRRCRSWSIYTVVTVLFVAIGIGAYKATRRSEEMLQATSNSTSYANGTAYTDDDTELLHTIVDSTTYSNITAGIGPETVAGSKYKSNGTSLFAPTTILISLDGFRADFLDRGLTPTLNSFIHSGVSPKYMTPSFPSVTFPNHFTLVTGLYPESHGIVGNTFWDPELQEEFSYHIASHSMQPKWWNGEPVWVTAEDQGVRVATHMWPGSEAHLGDIEPAFMDKFNSTERLDFKVDRVLELLDLPGSEDEGVEETGETRPQLILAYVPNVDADGHLYGPNSTQIRGTINSVDNMLYAILEGLKSRNLEDIVNVVIVSDHGMATTSTTRLIQLEDLIDTSLIEHIEGWPHYGLRPYDSNTVDMLYARLLSQTAIKDGFDVYLRDKTMPDRYHFSNNDRIAPLWIVPKTGWAIVTNDQFNVENALSNGEVFHPKGVHGYDHEHPLMRAIFVARGPAFPHTPGSKVEAFQNTEVYNIVCDSIGVDPKPNNGTLRLPLVPVGLHSDFEDDEEKGGEFLDPPVTSFVGQILTMSDPMAFVPPATATMEEGVKTTELPDWFHHATVTVDGVKAEATGDISHDVDNGVGLGESATGAVDVDAPETTRLADYEEEESEDHADAEDDSEGEEDDYSEDGDVKLTEDLENDEDPGDGSENDEEQVGESDTGESSINDDEPAPTAPLFSIFTGAPSIDDDITFTRPDRPDIVDEVQPNPADNYPTGFDNAVQDEYTKDEYGDEKGEGDGEGGVKYTEEETAEDEATWKAWVADQYGKMLSWLSGLIQGGVDKEVVESTTEEGTVRRARR